MLCNRCRKLAYESQHAAMRAVYGIRNRGNGSHGKAYRCPFGHWHITRAVREVKRQFRTREYWEGL